MAQHTPVSLRSLEKGFEPRTLPAGCWSRDLSQGVSKTHRRQSHTQKTQSETNAIETEIKIGQGTMMRIS